MTTSTTLYRIDTWFLRRQCLNEYAILTLTGYQQHYAMQADILPDIGTISIWWNSPPTSRRSFNINRYRPTTHDVQFSCAINQPLLAHHWMVHQCLLTSRFIAPVIPWGVSAPGGKMRKQLLKDHNFLNNSPIFITESSTYNILLFKKHCIQHISIWKIVFGFGERYLTP